MKLNRLKNTFTIFFGAILLLIGNSVTALQPDTYFDIGGGIRFDRLTTKSETFGTPLLQFLQGSTECKFLHKDKIKVKRLDLYVLQAKAQVRLCDYWFVKGYASYAWLTKGRYHEERVDRFLFEFSSKSDVDGGRARDWSAGAGYLYPGDGWWGCWGLGPVIGWSYDDQLYKMGCFETNCEFNPLLENLHYTSRWSGPWIGLDFVYEPCCYPLKLTSSLEFHWATWHGSRRLHCAFVRGVDFTDRRKSSNAHGLVFDLNLQWDVWCGFHIGLEGKVQFWDSHGGRIKPKDGNFRQLGFPNYHKIKLKHTRWYSDTFVLFVGYDY